MTFFTGLLPENPESRDDLCSSSVMGSTLRDYDSLLPLAPEESLPQRFVRTENQRNMSSCVGHAGSTVAEAAWYFATGEQPQFSRMFAYLKAQDQNNIRTDSGATIAGMVKAAKQDGFALESVHPYPSRYTRSIPPGAEEDAATRRMADSVWLESYQEIIRFLKLRLGAVLVGSKWVDSMKRSGGLIEGFNGRARGRHAWVIGGYTKRLDRKGNPYVVVNNSHGVRWGDGTGFAEMLPDAVDTMLRSGGDAVGLSAFPGAAPLTEANFTDGVLG